MGSSRSKSARERVDAIPDLKDLDRYRILEIARRLQRRYSEHRRSINPDVRYAPVGELDPGSWVTLASRLYVHKIDPDVYMTWVIQQISPAPVFPTTASSGRLFNLFLDDGGQQMQRRLDFEINYSATCLLARVGGRMSMREVLEEEIRKVGHRPTDQTASGFVAAQPDHLDVVVLYLTCLQEPGTETLRAKLLPFARLAMRQSPYTQSRIASQLPQELLDGHAFTAPGPNAAAKAVHGAVSVSKPSGT